MVALALERLARAAAVVTWPDAIHVPADPNGLACDRDAGLLYVADARGGAILGVTDGQHRRVATIESGGITSGNRVGGLAVTPYGTLYVTRLGYGSAGAVIRVEPDGFAKPLPGLAAHVWRVGIAYDAREHVLYTTQFLKSLTGPYAGSIAEIDLTTGEVTTVIDGFTKPVGIAQLDATLVVTDARQRVVVRIDRVAGRAARCRSITDRIERPDSICACGPDSVLVTAFHEQARRGSVHQVWLDGRTREIASGAWEPRGVATDGRHVFVSARKAGRVLVFPL